MPPISIESFTYFQGKESPSLFSREGKHWKNNYPDKYIDLPWFPVPAEKIGGQTDPGEYLVKEQIALEWDNFT